MTDLKPTHKAWAARQTLNTPLSQGVTAEKMSYRKSLAPYTTRRAAETATTPRYVSRSCTRRATARVG